MYKSQYTPAGEQTFTQFLFHNRRNRITLYLAAIVIITQLAIFKYLYPFASYINDDSYLYIKAAYENSAIATYPIGYSKFLRLVSVFAKPDLVLVSLQYLLMQCSTLFLLFTIFYFYKTGKVIQIILLCFMIFNPLLLHLANMVSSDGLFMALSMTWFMLLLWIIYKPSNKTIFWHAIVIFGAFTVRYNALIYPFISLFAFFLSKISLRKKVLGFGSGLLLIGLFMSHCMFQFKKFTGYWQFSPFSGWQLANNAMYTYKEVDSADRQTVPLKFRALDTMICKFYDSHTDLQLPEAGFAYMWIPWYPLMRYRDSLFNAKDPSATEFKKWASMGPFYSSYGLYIIKKYPMHFLRYFIWPNSKKFIAPPVEFLENYNMGSPTVPKSVVQWFGYTNNQVKTRMKNGKVWILQYYPYFITIANLIMLLMLLSYLALKGWQYNPAFNKSIMLAGLAWVGNAAFTIFAASPALRFQAFPALLTVTFSLLLIDWMAWLMQFMKLQSQQQKTDSQYSQNVSV